MIIPTFLHIGFRHQHAPTEDTLNPDLAYIVYYDERQVLHKTESLNNWRDKAIPTVDMENKPLTGFRILQTRIGGWASDRQISVRVRHPQNFEFEIPVSNLLRVLQYTDICNCIVQAPCAIGFDSSSTLLIPTTAPEYAQYTKQFDDLKKKRTYKAADLIPGHSYQNAAGRVFVYLGRHIDYSSEYLTPNQAAKLPDAIPDFFNLKNGKNVIQYLKPSAKPKFVWADLVCVSHEDDPNPVYQLPVYFDKFTNSVSYRIDTDETKMYLYEYNSDMRWTASCPNTIVKDLGEFPEYSRLRNAVEKSIMLNGIDFSLNSTRPMSFDVFQDIIKPCLTSSTYSVNLFHIRNGIFSYTPYIQKAGMYSNHMLMTGPKNGNNMNRLNISPNLNPITYFDSLQDLYNDIQPVIIQFHLKNGQIVELTHL